jgi:hypothetical protein
MSVPTPPIVGTWKASWCGLEVSTLRITMVNGVLGGTMIANEYSTKEGLTGCAAVGSLTGKRSELPLSNVSFDGQILRLAVAFEADQQTQVQQVQLRWANDTLTVIPDRSGQEARVFIRVM